MRIPYFVKLTSFKTDARESKLDGGVIRLSPDATHLSLEWTMNAEADQDLFQDLLLAYRREVGFWAGKRSDAPHAAGRLSYPGGEGASSRTAILQSGAGSVENRIRPPVRRACESRGTGQGVCPRPAAARK